jgi:hypothetical protein
MHLSFRVVSCVLLAIADATDARSAMLASVVNSRDWRLARLAPSPEKLAAIKAD